MAVWLTARQVRYAVLQCKVGKDGGRKRAVRGHGRDEDVRQGDAPDQGGRGGPKRAIICWDNYGISSFAVHMPDSNPQDRGPAIRSSLSRASRSAPSLRGIPGLTSSCLPVMPRWAALTSRLRTVASGLPMSSHMRRVVAPSFLLVYVRSRRPPVARAGPWPCRTRPRRTSWACRLWAPLMCEVTYPQELGVKTNTRLQTHACKNGARDHVPMHNI